MKSRHRNEEEVVLNLTVAVPLAVFEKFQSVREFFTKMPVHRIIEGYAQGCLRDFGTHEWDPHVAEHLTDEELDEAIEELEFERDLRAEVEDEDGGEPEADDSLEIEVETSEVQG